MLAKKFEMKTAEYGFRALNVVAASVGSTISEREFATVKGQVVNTKKVSDYQGEWYGNYLTLRTAGFFGSTWILRGMGIISLFQ